MVYILPLAFLFSAFVACNFDLSLAGGIFFQLRQNKTFADEVTDESTSECRNDSNLDLWPVQIRESSTRAALIGALPPPLFRM